MVDYLIAGFGLLGATFAWIVAHAALSSMQKNL